jgi:uncharacterized membrane protein YcjF (UPF0283 family)
MSSSGPCQSRLGFDLVTTLVGSGATLLVSAAIVQYGDQITRWSRTELYAGVGGGLLALGLLVGVVFVAAGWR